MRNIMIFAALMVGLGTMMAQMADKMTATTPVLANPASRKAAAVETPAPSGLRNLSIPPDSRGHFLTEGRIDGQRIGFMVDTGASVIALNESSAARFGLRPSRGDYNSTVTTANGTIKAARARLAMVDIGGRGGGRVRGAGASPPTRPGKPTRPPVPGQPEPRR